MPPRFVRLGETCLRPESIVGTGYDHQGRTVVFLDEGGKVGSYYPLAGPNTPLEMSPVQVADEIERQAREAGAKRPAPAPLKAEGDDSAPVECDAGSFAAYPVTVAWWPAASSDLVGVDIRPGDVWGPLSGESRVKVHATHSVDRRLVRVAYLPADEPEGQSPFEVDAGYFIAKFPRRFSPDAPMPIAPGQVWESGDGTAWATVTKCDGVWVDYEPRSIGGTLVAKDRALPEAAFRKTYCRPMSPVTRQGDDPPQQPPPTTQGASRSHLVDRLAAGERVRFLARDGVGVGRFGPKVDAQLVERKSDGSWFGDLSAAVLLSPHTLRTMARGTAELAAIETLSWLASFGYQAEDAEDTEPASASPPPGMGRGGDAAGEGR